MWLPLKWLPDRQTDRQTDERTDTDKLVPAKYWRPKRSLVYSTGVLLLILVPKTAIHIRSILMHMYKKWKIKITIWCDIAVKMQEHSHADSQHSSLETCNYSISVFTHCQVCIQCTCNKYFSFFALHFLDKSAAVVGARVQLLFN